MTIQILKKTLNDENDLLDEMIKLVSQYPDNKFTDQAKYIKKSWIRFLTERKNTNTAQQKANDTDLKNDFLSEIDQLDAYLKVTIPNPDYTEQWKTFLQCERDISDYLCNQIP